MGYDFLTIAKQRMRMCDFYSASKCQGCPFNGTIPNYTCLEYIMTYPEQSARVISEWSSDHPIFTNAEKFKQVFGYTPKTDICILNVSCSGVCNRCEHKEFWNKEYKESK